MGDNSCVPLPISFPVDPAPGTKGECPEHARTVFTATGCLYLWLSLKYQGCIKAKHLSAKERPLMGPYALAPPVPRYYNSITRSVLKRRNSLHQSSHLPQSHLVSDDIISPTNWATNSHRRTKWIEVLKRTRGCRREQEANRHVTNQLHYGSFKSVTMNFLFLIVGVELGFAWPLDHIPH